MKIFDGLLDKFEEWKENKVDKVDNIVDNFLDKVSDKTKETVSGIKPPQVNVGVDKNTIMIVVIVLILFKKIF